MHAMVAVPQGSFTVKTDEAIDVSALEIFFQKSGHIVREECEAGAVFVRIRHLLHCSAHAHA